MHIPNGFLSNPVCTATTAAAVVGLAASAVRLRQARHAPPGIRMALIGATVFAAQMVNFSIDHGTSGHPLGAALAAIALGPWAGSLVMTIVLVIQCLLFADGGLSALGANVVNMALLAVLFASATYKGASRWIPGPRGRLIGAALAGWVSVMVAACACSLELAASGTQTLINVLLPMAAIHAVIGLSEALLTAAAVAVLLAARRRTASEVSSPSRGQTLAGLGVALSIVVLLAPLASTEPDGLERVAATLHITPTEGPTPLAVAPDYLWPGIGWEPLSVAIAGILGVAAVFFTTWLVSRCEIPHEAPALRGQQ